MSDRSNKVECQICGAVFTSDPSFVHLCSDARWRPAVPAGEWTRTPPTEPGWYWWRNIDYKFKKHSDAKPCELIRAMSGNMYWDFQGYILDDPYGREYWTVQIAQPVEKGAP